MNNHIKDCEFGFFRAVFGEYDRFKYSGTDTFMYSGTNLIHYTNLIGLHGILKEQGFWLSDHRFLNDSEEYNNGKLLLERLLKRLRNKNKYNDFIRVLNGVLDLCDSKEESPYYICSFSTREDSLDQWKAYAKDDDGVAIVFKNNTKNLSGHFNMVPIFTTSKVIYKDNKKYKILLYVIHRFLREFRCDVEEENNIDIDTWSEELFKALSRKFINFKHIEFESEREVRIVVSELTWGKDSEPIFEIKHRVSNNKIVPYINLSDIYKKKYFDNKKLPMERIIIAPSSTADVTRKSVEIYLQNIGYSNVGVYQSKVPFRG